MKSKKGKQLTTFKGLFAGTAEDMPTDENFSVAAFMTDEEKEEFRQALIDDGLIEAPLNPFTVTQQPLTREYLAELNTLLGLPPDELEQAKKDSAEHEADLNRRNALMSDLDYEIGKRLSRASFWEYCLFYDNDFFSRRPFLRAVAVLFEWVYTEYLAGRPRRVAISMPPRAGKSYIASLFCAWWLGKLPTLSVMRNTCTARLYFKFSYDVRKIVKSDKHKAVFPGNVIASDKQNVEGWNLTEAKQVSYFGAGVGGTIIGFGANLAITDDLYSGMEDALSENYDEKVHMWKESDHDSRKERNCPEIFIGTRWTVKDVIGKALESGKIHKEIKIPALVVNKYGELVSFCDDVKTTAEYLEMKDDTEESIWLAEWMQEPIEAKGLLFPKASLKFFKRDSVDLSKAEYRFSYVDPADEGGDSLSAPYCELIDDRIYVSKVLYNTDGTDVNEPEVVDMVTRKSTNLCQVEGNSAWVLFGRAVRKAVQAITPDCEIRIIKNTVNKHTRILAMAAFIRNHFYFADDYMSDPQYRAFMKNLCGYLKEGKAKHDDAPDSMAGCAKFFQAVFPELWVSGNKS